MLKLVMCMGGCNVVGPSSMAPISWGWLPAVQLVSWVLLGFFRWWPGAKPAVHHKSFIMIYWGDLYRNNLLLSVYLKVRVNGFNVKCWGSAVILPGISSQRVKLTQSSTAPPPAMGWHFPSGLIPFSLKRNRISHVHSFQMPVGHY